MKKVLSSATALAALFVAPGLAQADTGWYGRADVGYSFAGDTFGSEADYEAPAPLVAPPVGTRQLNTEADLEEDWMQSLGLGYAFANGFRLEGELGHRFNSIEPDANFGGDDIHAWSGMLNGIYDFNHGGSIQPYIGVGVGAARLLNKAYTPLGNQQVNGEDTVFAYQGLIGIGFTLSPQATLDLGYRYFVANGGSYDGISTSPTVLAGSSWDGDYTHQAVTLGLRWAFDAPAPPPPPPAPPPPPPPPPPEAAPPPVQVCPVQEFKVYFDWDRSNLNTAANDTISQAAQRARSCNVQTVRVVGYTDTSGSPRYNLGLSQRRAQVVVDALVGAGIPAAVITSEGAGETNLDKATADGVREPLNRRSAATITFR
jgi:OmpA-OmpF porin, OOP family